MFKDSSGLTLLSQILEIEEVSTTIFWDSLKNLSDTSLPSFTLLRFLGALPVEICTSTPGLFSSIKYFNP